MRPLKTGDVFHFLAPDGRHGIGQIARGRVVMWIVIFRDLFTDLPPPEELAKREILLSAWTTDALFFHERWTVFGNYPVSEDRIPQPSYVARQGDNFFVESFDESDYRPATQDDLDRLKYRFSVSPKSLQDALLAHHGFDDWKEHYDELTVEAAWKWTPA
jgi:hypothetical protein